MVGRGEVDEDLEGETKEECEKYGKVVKCVIFEVRAEDSKDEEDVLITQDCLKNPPLLRSQRCWTKKRSGYFWSLSEWSQPSKVSMSTNGALFLCRLIPSLWM